MATIKSHYDDHLGKFYSWMLGDFAVLKDGFQQFCRDHAIVPPGEALDLGCGNGIHSVALAELGFSVIALDFNAQLLEELDRNRASLPVKTVNADMRQFRTHITTACDLILCCGDTLSHLNSFAEVYQFLRDIRDSLAPGGKLLVTFRDYSAELHDTDRFIPVKSDHERILTCMLEYFPDTVRVTDLLHEKGSGGWIQKVSSYEKLRLTRSRIMDELIKTGFTIETDTMWSRMVALVAVRL